VRDHKSPRVRSTRRHETNAREDWWEERGEGALRIFLRAAFSAVRALCFPLVALSGIDRAARSYGGLQVHEITGEESVSEWRSPRNRRGSFRQAPCARSRCSLLEENEIGKSPITPGAPGRASQEYGAISRDNGQTPPPHAASTRCARSATRALELFCSDVRVEYWRSVEAAHRIKAWRGFDGLIEPRSRLPRCTEAAVSKIPSNLVSPRQARRSSRGNRYS